jgi:hypothetical protein
MAETRQTTFGPESIGPQDIFVINDISLTIPPTSISVRKEDLTYQWRTLRTKSATKIPTGHGQVVVHVSIPFTSTQFLSLHRLITQFRHSPFCYIENRYIRESIVPGWGKQQNMAFTMTNIHLSPYPGSSDTWMVELDLIWFNYFPYMHNYLFRDDWQTKSISGGTALGPESVYIYSIGWQLNKEDYSRTNNPSILVKDFFGDSKSSSFGKSLFDNRHINSTVPLNFDQKWDVTQGLYQDKTSKTLYDMQVNHSGVEFDLLPLPGNMSPARPMQTPASSRIYTRYINLLQRDALYKHFQIDVEKDLFEYISPQKYDPNTPETGVIAENILWDTFFSTIDDQNPKTYGLHTLKLPSPIRRKWVGEMLAHNHSLRFVFNAYQEVKLPKGLTDKVDDDRTALISRISKMSRLPGSEGLLQTTITKSGPQVVNQDVREPGNVNEHNAGYGGGIEVPYQEEVRKGFYRPIGKHVPIGKNISEMLSLISTGVNGEQVVKVRTDAELQRLYKGNKDTAKKRIVHKVYTSSGRHSSIHYGTDFGGTVGDEVFAVEAGVVIGLDNEIGSGTRWTRYTLSTGKRSPIQISETASDSDFYLSIQAAGLAIDENEKKKGNVRLTDKHNNKAGAYILSQTAGVYYISEYGSGGMQLTIRHVDESTGAQSFSKYAHLSGYGPGITYGSTVVAGQTVAYLGESASFDSKHLEDFFVGLTSVDSEDPFGESPADPIISDVIPMPVEQNAFTLSSHLHFEYWESRDIPSPHATKKTVAFEPTENFGGNRNTVVVNIKDSYSLAVDKSLDTIELITLDESAVKDNRREVLDNAEEDGLIDEGAAESLTEMFTLLASDGWRYYDKDIAVVNVWEKTISVEVVNSGVDLANNNLADLTEYTQEGVVLANINGQLSHIVANLPILSHEFPTQQHLGSIEPSYNLSFAISDHHFDLGGISTVATFIEGMRSLLQSNARRFRPVSDGWCVSTDTFLTRMLGSFNGQDVMIDLPADAAAAGIDFRLRKRTLISRSTSQTVEGQPGLSMLSMTLEETNPYDIEKINSTAPQKGVSDAAKALVLQKLLDLDFIEEYKERLIPVFVAQSAGLDTRNGVNDWQVYGIGLKVNTVLADWNMGLWLSEQFGTLDRSTANLSTNQDVFIEQFDGQEMLMIRASGADEQKEFFQKIFGDAFGDKPYEEFLFTSGSSEYIRLPLEDVDSVLGNDVGGSQHTWFGVDPVVWGDDGDPESPWAGVRQAAGVVDGAATWYMREVWGGQLDTWDYDLTYMFEEDPGLGEIPITKIRDYYVWLSETIHTAQRMLAEVEVGGLTNAHIQDSLFGLPVNAHMWQSWQTYLKGFVVENQTRLGVRGAVQDLLTSTNYPAPRNKAAASIDEGGRNPNFGWEVDLSLSSPGEYNSLFSITQKDKWTAGQGAISSIDDYLVAAITSTYSAVSSPNINVSDLWVQVHNNAINRLVETYMNEFPYALKLSDDLKNKYDWLVGDILGDDRVGSLQSMQTSLFINAYSVGNIRAGRDGNPYWQVDPYDGWDVGYAPTPEEAANTIITEKGGLAGVARNLTSPLAILNSEDGSNAPKQGFEVDISRWVDRSITAFADIHFAQEDIDYLSPADPIGAPLNSPFLYPTTMAEEESKIRYLSQILSVIANDLIADPGILKVLGLEHLSNLDIGNSIVGSECYPDMDLPFHPYYGDTFQTSPDFYMWNIYEDGNAFGIEEQEVIYKSVDNVVQRCYDSLHSLQEGRTNSTSTEQVLQEPGLGMDNRIDTRVQVQCEGADKKNPQDGSGTSSCLSAPTLGGEESSAAFEVEVGENGSSQADSLLTGANPKHIRIASTEGIGGSKLGGHYPSRGDGSVYKRLEKRLEDSEHMFGSQQGFMRRQNSNLEVAYQENADDVKDSNLEMPAEEAHTYNPESLKKLARDSAKDLMSQKKSLRRAYPTFKLFFVEEDKIEGRLLSFDDFYSYNAVKEFSIVMSRKMPADHAVITVQNVSGTLDGTRRNTIADLDYYDGTAKKKLADGGFDSGVEDGHSLSGDSRFKDTAQEQPFGALVLRPGLNVQLRCGYSNDPDNLQVMISGRIVDLAWNKTGDLAELTVQSFGTELMQAIKGMGVEGAGATYQTTHELLGSLMMEPEVVHFGRWAFGELKQLGEDSDYRLDFHDYSHEGSMGRFRATSWLTSAVANNPGWIFLASAGALALNFFPATALLGRFGKVAKFASKGLVAPSASIGRGASNWKVALGIAGKSKVILTAAQKRTQIAAAKEVLEAGVKTANVSDEFAKFLIAQTARTLALLEKATDADDFVKIVDKGESIIRNAALRGLWMSDPSVVSGGAVKIVMEGVGFQPVKQAFSLTMTSVVRAITATAVVGLGADAINAAILEPLYDATVKNVIEFFQTKQSHLFLSPQDDNLYVPHPKDYMRSHDGKDFLWIKWPTISQAAEAGVTILSKTLVDNPTAEGYGDWAGRLVDPDKFLSKKVDSDACKYQLISTTTWEVFHEMTLRHPGWIYGPRPYGTEFRYTMFFGPPAQRYWSKPASNGFILRANKLRRYLGSPSMSATSDQNFDITKQEFEELYSPGLYEEVRAEIALQDQAEENANGFANGFASVFAGNAGLTAVAEVFEEQRIAARENKVLTSIAMKEYLRSLEIRFVPFRRYHMFTSDKDIIWNGIISSERSVINAVDVTYFKEKEEAGSEPAGSSVFKAHTFIPEYMLNIAPVVYPNCKGYEMAMRYGMGSLLYGMRDMYRGEILLLGNPRIRPWDVGILIDTYNDMVGPVEVEQVVHTMSHETGFVTEIKPSAVVFANEISGWPMTEAMKLFAVAVEDIEGRYTGHRGGDSVSVPLVIPLGAISAAVNPAPSALQDAAVDYAAAAVSGAAAAAFTPSEGYDRRIERLRQERFDGDVSIENVFGETPPDTTALDARLNEFVDLSLNVTTAFGASTALAGGFALGSKAIDAVGEAVAESVVNKNNVSILKTFYKTPRSVVAGVALVGGTAAFVGAQAVGGLRTSGKLDFPSLAWLVGGPVLFLQCMRNEAVVCVPLIKNGQPIVSGLSFQDPGMIWNQFRGEIRRWADDTISGTNDMIQLWDRQGSHLWNAYSEDNLSARTGEANFLTR